MTESKLRNSEFLLPKVIAHARQWKDSHAVLSLGSLDSYRNINHAADVASAIRIIINQEAGDDYLVCGNEHHMVLDIVKKVYAKFGIVLEENGDMLYDTVSGLPVIQTSKGFRNHVTDINGNATKLLALGWAPKYNIDTLLLDIIEC